KWGTMAAEAGNSIAQNNLGAAYTHGYGVEKDLQQAFNWYQKAAQQGYVLAQYNLAAAYAMGAGVEQDYVKALAWFTLVQQAQAKQSGQQASEQAEFNGKLQSTIERLKEILTEEGKLEQAQSLAKQYASQYMAH
ncbi:MAG: tetratricopeptide repeat protein, partial [Enterobacteriaceae bacterium]